MRKLLAFILALSVILSSVCSIAEGTTSQVTEPTVFSAPITTKALKGQTTDSIATDRTNGAAATILLLTELHECNTDPAIEDFFRNIYSSKSFVAKDTADTVLIIVPCNETTIFFIYYNPEKQEASYTKKEYPFSSFKEINKTAKEIAGKCLISFENNPDNLLTTMEFFMNNL